MGGVLVTLLQWQNEYTQCPHPTRRRARDAHAQQQAATLPLPRCVAEAVMHATYCTRHTTQHGDAAADAHAAAATAAATTTTTAVGTRVQWMHDAGHYGAPYTLPGDDRGDGQGTASAQRAMSRTAAASKLRDSTQAHNDNNSDGRDAVGGDDKDDDDETAALLMGTMDCVDAYAYLRSAKPSAHADEESAVYAAADTATQLIAHWHRRRGAHNISSSSNNASTTRAHDANDDDATDDGVPPPLLLLLSRGVSSDAFVSLVSTLRRCCCCCRPHASELAVSWRSVLDTSPATPATRTQQQQKQRATTNTAVPAATAAAGAATRRRMWCADTVYYLGPRQYMTYGELWSRVRALSCALRALRVRPGDMLLLLDDTRVEWLVTCYAAWWCGMVVVVLHDSPQCLARAAHDVACDRVRVVVCKHTALRALRRQMTRARRDVCSSGNNGSSDDEASVTSHTAAATTSTDDDSDVHCRSVAWRLLASRRRPVYIATRTLLTSSNSDGDNNKDSEDDEDEDVLRWCEVVEHGEAVHARVRRDTSASSPSSSWSSSPVELRASDLAMIAYTEGEAKGVMLTHGALAASLAAYCANIADMQLWQRSDSDSHGEDSVDEDKDDECAADKHSIAHGRRRGGCVTDAYGEHDTTVSAASSAAAAADDDNNNGDNTTRPRYLAYMPMHTVREVMLQTASLLHGVLVCYGAAATLYDHAARPRGDLAEYKPHLLTATPATLDALCARVQHSLSHGYRRLLFDAGVAARQRALHRGLDTPLLHRVLFAQPRSLLGGCCRVVLATAAPLQPRTRRYVEVVCGVSVRQLYSCVEAAGCGLLQHSGSALHHHNASDAGGDEDDEDEDNVGVPHASLVLKLRDVSRRWRHSDVLPAGELLVCGPAVMCGYYRQPERTAEVLERVRCRCRLRCRRHRSNDDGSSASGDDDNNEGNGVRTRRGRHHSSSVCGCTAQQHQHGSGGDCVCGSHSSNSMDSMHTNKDDDSSSTSSSSSSSEEDDDEQQPQHTATRSTYCTGWWLHTGSIAQRTREGTLRIVDCMSASNVTNACGRRLSLEQLEDMYSRHALCLRAGVCVLVHPFRDYVCALVLTDEARARAFVHSVQQQQQRVVHGTTTTTTRAADNDDNSSTRRLRMTWPYCLREAGFNRAAAAALAAHAAQHRAAAHERVRAVRVLYDEWSVYNGLRTTTGRLRRDRIAAKYADVIAELFAQPSSRS